MTAFSKASDIKVGVIGYGGAFNMGKKHLEEMRTAGMTPAAVCEIDASRLAVASKDFPGIQTFAGVTEMLRQAEVDLLAIITPHNTHAKLALQCLKAGRSVVCEKPFAITTAECDAMIAAADKAGVMVSTYHNRHWDGCALHAVQRVLREQAIGEVFRVECTMGGYGQPGDWWRTSKSISGGVLYDWGVHLLEYALQLLPGSRIKEVAAHAQRGFWARKTRWGKDTNEDEAQVDVRFTDGKWLTLRITTLDARPRDRWVQVTGTQGVLAFDGGTYELCRQEGGKRLVESGRNPAGQGQKFYDNIAAHLTKGRKLIITPQWARRPIHILDLANQSIRADKAVKARYA